MKRSQLLSGLATGPELNQQLRDSGKDSNFSAVIEEFSTSVVSRPSNITGSKYESVGSAYAHAVHSVLTGKRGAQEAAAQQIGPITDLARQGDWTGVQTRLANQVRPLELSTSQLVEKVDHDVGACASRHYW
jgi:hypothetical protein